MPFLPDVIEHAVERIENTPETVVALVNELAEHVGELVVDSDEAHAKLRPLYSEAREWEKKIEAWKKEQAAPLRKKINAINDKAAMLLEPLQKVISLCNKKTNEYSKLLESKRKAEEVAAREAAEVLGLSESVYVPEVTHTLKGDGATTITKTVKRFEVVDWKLVPLKYLVIDEKIVNEDIKMGKQDIPGLRIFEETITTLRTR